MLDCVHDAWMTVSIYCVVSALWGVQLAAVGELDGCCIRRGLWQFMVVQCLGCGWTIFFSKTRTTYFRPSLWNWTLDSSVLVVKISVGLRLLGRERGWLLG
jgi:hypothetical protein